MTIAHIERQYALEALIDRHTPAIVLNDFAVVCREKAAHIRTNWQDDATARPWDQLAGRLETLARVAVDKGL